MASKAPELIGINALAYYIKRIQIFLESDKKTISFPNISQELHNVLVKISENTDFICDNMFSDNVKLEAAKLAASLKKHDNIKIVHEICDGKFGSNVLMYKKIERSMFKVPENGPLRKPSVMTTSTAIEAPPDGSVSPIFKTRCLNAATKFVKDDSQLVMRFPEMVTTQVEFIMDMIKPGIEGSKDPDVGFGYRSMYAPLWESMRLFSLKYEYKIVYDTRPVTKEGMKRLVFEKIPKCPTIDLTDSDNESDTPEVLIVDSDHEKINNGVHSTPIATSLKTKAQTESQKYIREKVPKHTRKLPKLIKKMQIMMQTGQIPSDFVQDSLRRISEFVMDEQLHSIVFVRMSIHQVHFLANVVRLSVSTETYMLFSADCQRYLDDIKYCWNVRRVRYELVRGKNCIVFEKLPPKTSGKDSETSEQLNSSFSSESSASLGAVGSEQKTVVSQNQSKIQKNKRKRINKLKKKLKSQRVTEEFIQKTLEDVDDFMNDEQQASLVVRYENAHQAEFIQQIGFIACEEQFHALFTDKSRKHLANISNCFKNNILIKNRAVKKRRVFILEKQVQFSNNQSVKDLKNDKILATSSSSSTSFNTDSNVPSEFSKKQPVRSSIDKKTQKLLDMTYLKLRAGTIQSDVVYNILKNICDFMYDEQRNALVLQDLTANLVAFVKVAEYIARDQALYSVFTNQSQKLLRDLNRCIKRNMLYIVVKRKSQPDTALRLVKEEWYSTKDIIKEREKEQEESNNENVNNTNIVNTASNETPLSQLDQERLIRLKAMKDAVARTFGEKSIEHYLQDISNFLLRSNINRKLTFNDVSENEALFLKNVNVLSKTKESYSMFTRDCQKLLTDIQFNARSYKLTCQMNVDENNRWKLTIEKQSLSEKDNVSGVVSRARSLSGGRNLANTKLQRGARDFSSQRESRKEKLKAALAQPVQSDKALRMMASMGWKGGALGARGDGIVEPITLPLDLATRAGLGHVPKTKSTPESKLKEAKKLKAKPESVPKKQKPAKSGTDLIPVIMPLKSLAPDILPPGIKPAGSVEKCKTVVLQSNYRVVLLRSILEMITTEIDAIHFICQEQNSHKSIGFIKHAVQIFNLRGRFDLADEVMIQLVREISHIFGECRGLMLSAEIRSKNVLYTKPIAVVRKIKLVPIFPKIRNKAIALIYRKDIKDDIKINDKKATDDQETTMAWYLDHNTVKNKSFWQITQSKHSRMWYFPLEPKSRHKVREKITKATRNEIPELKVLALLAVCQVENIGIDFGITTSYQKTKLANSQNITTTNDYTIVYDEKITDGKESKTNRCPKLTENLVSSSWYQIAEPDSQWNVYVKSKFQNCEQKAPLTEVGNSEIIESDVEMTSSNGHQTTYKNNDEIKTSHDHNIITISDEEDTSNDHKTTSEDREQSNAKNINKTIEQELTTNGEEITTINEKTSENHMLPYEDPVNKENTLKTRVKSQILKIPNMTRKHFSIANENIGIFRPEKTTYALEIHHYKLNENIFTNVKVTKDPPENYSNDRKRMKLSNEIMSIPKIQAMPKLTKNIREQQLATQQKSEIEKSKKSSSGVLLEKQMIDTDSTIDRYVSKQAKKRINNAKSSLAERLVNATSDSNVTVKIDNERAKNNTSKMNTVAPMVQNITPMVKNDTPVVNLNNVTIEKEKKPINSDTPKVAPMMKNVNIDVAVEKDNESTNYKTPKMKMAIPIVNENNNLTVKKDNKSTNINAPILNDGNGKGLLQKENKSTYSDVPSIQTVGNFTVTKENKSTNNNSEIPYTDSDLDCKVTESMKIIEKNNTIMKYNCNDHIGSDSESVTYIIPVESKITIIRDNNNITECIHKNTVTIETNDLKEKCNVKLCNAANRNELYGKDDTSQNSEMKSLLNDGDDGEINKLADILNNVATCEKQEKIRNRTFLKAKHSIKNALQQVENKANEVDNDSHSHYDTSNSVIETEASLQKISERRRPSLDFIPNSTSKKFKLLTDFKKIYIIPNNYPQTKIETETARQVQSAILKSIDEESVPYLKCHGIQNGGLIYSCQDEKSLLFLERLVENMEDLKVVYEFDVQEQLSYKMAFRINSFIDEPVSNILNRFELYNSELNATKWGVIKKEQCDDFTVIYVDVDESSFNYICAVNFILYAGNDCARFTILWD